MKNLFKLTTAALALVALASCSNDDLFERADIISNRPQLNVNVESMGDEVTTRTAYSGKNGRIWIDGDEFTVYDEQLHIYDLYSYNKVSNVFALSEGTQKDVEVAQFLAYPSSNVSTTYWDKATRTTSIDMGIPAEWDFNEFTEGEVIYYTSQLPMWGTATADGENVKANAQFLTSYIKVTIDNALNNVDAVRVSAWSDIAGSKDVNIAGIANAVLSDANGVKEVTQLTTPTKGDITYPQGNTIMVNLVKDEEKLVKSGTSCIFIPLIAGKYGKVTVDYLKAGGSKTNTGDWTVIKTWYDQEFERGGLPYGASLKTFQAAAKNVAQLNEVINTRTADKGDITVQVVSGQNTGVSNSDATVGASVVLPAMECDKITINVNKFNGTSASQSLTISGESFTKTVVLNVTTFTNISKFTVDLPNAENVILAGPFKKAGEFVVANAKKLTFGDGTNATKFGDLGNLEGKAIINGIVVENKATVGALAPIAECGNIEVKEGGIVDGITVAENHRATSVKIAGASTKNLTVHPSVIAAATTVEVSGKVADIHLAGSTNDAIVTVSGKSGNVTHNGTGTITINGYAKNVTIAKGDITISGYCEDVTSTEGDITISGDPIWNDARGTATYAKTANVTAKNGNVTVDLTAGKEGAAVSGTLTFNSDATLTLNNGYIAAVTVTGTPGATVKVTNGAAGYTSLGTVTLTTTGKDFLKIQNASEWNGKNIGDGISKPGTGDSYEVADVKTAYEAANKYVSTNNIYTATEFAYKVQGQSVNDWQAVCNDINLGNKTFTPATKLVGKVFEGNKSIKADNSYPTISNLTLAECPKNAQGGYGLFMTTTRSSMSNLTFDGITITMNAAGGCKNIGGIIGVLNATEAVAYSNITVKNVSISGTKLASAIGAFIGQLPGTAIAGATFTDVTVDSVKITGYNEIGGFIGEVNNGAKVTFAKGGTTAAPTFCSAKNIEVTQLTDATKDADASLAKVGTFIGFTDSKTAANVEINLATLPGVTGYTVTNASKIDPLIYFPEADGESVTKRAIVRSQYLIGYCGNVTTTKVTLNDNLSASASKSGEYISLGKINEAPASTVKYIDYIKGF